MDACEEAVTENACTKLRCKTHQVIICTTNYFVEIKVALFFCPFRFRVFLFSTEQGDSGVGSYELY